MLKPPRPRPVPLILLAAVLVGLGLVVACPGALRGLLTSWLGPPQVALTESYEATQGEATFDHSTFDGLVSTYVDDAGYVDYEGLAADTSALDAYIASLADAPFDALGRDAKLGLLINAYNAFTLRLILDHYPVDSIKDIPSAERWEAVRWNVAGGTWSLDQIEHQLIRGNFREPRIHFALVCAAVGCPPLRNEAYVGERIDEQLESQTVYTHSHDRWLRYEPGADTIGLTSLYDWYGGDFVQVAGSVLAFVARYDEDLARELAAGHEPKIRFLDYDWSLNER
jgi:Protein of unknown function, DUF547